MIEQLLKTLTRKIQARIAADLVVGTAHEASNKAHEEYAEAHRKALDAANAERDAIAALHSYYKNAEQEFRDHRDFERALFGETK